MNTILKMTTAMTFLAALAAPVAGQAGGNNGSVAPGAVVGVVSKVWLVQAPQASCKGPACTSGVAYNLQPLLGYYSGPVQVCMIYTSGQDRSVISRTVQSNMAQARIEIKDSTGRNSYTIVTDSSGAPALEEHLVGGPNTSPQTPEICGTLRGV